MEPKSVIGWVGSGVTTIFGMITLNQVAIMVGILTGLSTIGVNLYTFLVKRKEQKNK